MAFESQVPDANPFGTIGQIIQSIIGLPGQVAQGAKEGGVKGAAKAGASSIGDLVSEAMGAVGDSITPSGQISVSTLLDLGGKRTAMRKERELETKLTQMKMERAQQELQDYPIEHATKLLGLQTGLEQSSPDVQDQIASILAPPPQEVPGQPTTEADQAQYAQNQAELAPLGLSDTQRAASRQQFEELGTTLEATGLPRQIINTLPLKERQEMLRDYGKDGWKLAQQKELARYTNSLPSKVGPSTAQKAWMEYQGALTRGNPQEVFSARENWINSLKGNTTIQYQNAQTGEAFSGTGPEIGGYLDKVRLRDLDNRITAIGESNALIDQTLSIMSPSNMGTGGVLRQNWQNAVAQLGSVGAALFQTQSQEAATLYQYIEPGVEGEELRKQLGRAIPGNPYYDPSMSALESMFTILAYKQARALDPSGRLAKEDVELASVSIGNKDMAYEDAAARLKQAKTANNLTIGINYKARQAMLASQGENPMRAAARRMEAQRGLVPIESLSYDDMDALAQDPLTPQPILDQIDAFLTQQNQGGGKK